MSTTPGGLKVDSTKSKAEGSAPADQITGSDMQRSRNRTAFGRGTGQRGERVRHAAPTEPHCIWKGVEVKWQGPTCSIHGNAMHLEGGRGQMAGSDLQRPQKCTAPGRCRCWRWRCGFGGGWLGRVRVTVACVVWWRWGVGAALRNGGEVGHDGLQHKASSGWEVECVEAAC